MVAADLVILAIYTGEIAAAKKNITNSIFPADSRFFAVMNADRTDVEFSIASTYTNFALQPICITITWANIAAR
jgi:hypothetical protein